MSKSFFESKKWKTSMNFVYGFGAAIVIVGALFKILHWPGANIMLTVGLLTEAGIFVISAFEPVHMDPDWSLVYPELAGGEPTVRKEKPSSSNLLQALSKAEIPNDVIESFGNGLTSLSNNVKEMSNLASVTVATNEYAESASKAARNMNDIAHSSAVVSDSLNSFTSGLSGVLNNISATEAATNQFKDEMSRLNQNLGNLNSIYGNMLSAMGGTR